MNLADYLPILPHEAKMSLPDMSIQVPGRDSETIDARLPGCCPSIHHDIMYVQRHKMELIDKKSLKEDGTTGLRSIYI